jgi:hypothetical protein
MSNIRIDGEFFDVSTSYCVYGDNTVSDGRMEWHLFASSDDAGKAARKYWEDMAERDPAEIRMMVGDETLIAWALGRRAGPGQTRVNSLTEWFDLWLDTPEEHFAGYDGTEASVKAPTGDERQRMNFIRSLGQALDEGFVTDASDGEECAGVTVEGVTYWLMEEGYGGWHGTRFSATPYGEAIAADKGDVLDAVNGDEIAAFVQEWDALVEDLGYTPTVAYRSN